MSEFLSSHCRPQSHKFSTCWEHIISLDPVFDFQDYLSQSQQLLLYVGISGKTNTESEIISSFSIYENCPLMIIMLIARLLMTLHENSSEVKVKLRSQEISSSFLMALIFGKSTKHDHFSTNPSHVYECQYMILYFLPFSLSPLFLFSAAHSLPVHVFQDCIYFLIINFRKGLRIL